MATVARAAPPRSSFARRNRKFRLVRVAYHDLVDGRCDGIALSALQRHGFFAVRLPELAVAAPACYAACSKVVALPSDEKAMHGAGPGAGQQHGYMDFSGSEGVAEAFEAKLHHDPRYTWPQRSRLRDAVGDALSLLHATALTTLHAVVRAAGLNEVERRRLVNWERDVGGPKPTPRGLRSASDRALPRPTGSRDPRASPVLS